MTWRVVLAPGAIRNRRGLRRSQVAAPLAGRTRGLPRSARVNPARETSTRSGRRPGFRTVIAEAERPVSSRRKGLALRPMPRPAEESRHDGALHRPITVNVRVAV
jgi:hypothetical protein